MESGVWTAEVVDHTCVGTHIVALHHGTYWASGMNAKLLGK